MLQFLGSALWLFIAVICILAASHNQSVVGLVFGVILLPLAAIQFACAHGLWNLRSYGRTIQIVFACLGLIGFPLGTLLSVLILIYMTRPGMAALFSGKRAQDLTPQEVEAVHRVTASGFAVAIVAVVVVVLVGVMFAGIMAAVAIPNLLIAIERGKQKRTINDMGAIAQALENYAAAEKRYPDTGSIDELASQLEPLYMQILPRTDGWGRKIFYAAWNEDASHDGADSYALVSAGKGGEWEQSDPRAYSSAETDRFEADIVLRSGESVQWPRGLQRWDARSRPSPQRRASGADS